jgi:16S rRNA (uracil1498-N3)-methyltransferase
MPRYDFHTPRLYVDAPLVAGTDVVFDRNQTNYLRNVLRLGQGDAVLLFNGRDGEWRASLSTAQRRSLSATTGAQLRTQPAPADLHFLFAPLKHARLDYMVQKAVEMGASLLQPVITRHTQVARVNLERMRANVIEAAEQCGVLQLPDVTEPLPFERLPHDPDRLLVFCDEAADADADAVAALSSIPEMSRGRLAVLVGPEGGFAEEERAALLKRPKVLRIALGPRILRADTAAVAALALVQAVLGDWKGRSG